MRKSGWLFLSVTWLVLALFVTWNSLADSTTPPEPTPTSTLVPEPVASSSSTPSASATPSPISSTAGSDGNSISGSNDTASPSDSPSASPTPPPIEPLADQSMYLIMPRTIPVDPRAHSALIPQIFFIGPGSLLLCIDSNNISFNFPENDQVQMLGNGSEHLLLTGSYASISSLFNSSNGTRVISNLSGIGNSQALFRFVAMSEPSIDKSFCSGGISSNTRTLSFKALQLTLNIVKASVNVKK